MSTVTGPCQTLAALADEELALVLDGRAEELGALHDRREAAMADLRAAGPPRAADDVAALRHALGIQDLVTQAIRERADGLRAELGTLDRGRAAAHGYGRTGL